MKHWMGMPVAAALLLSACVTINVYFPAAEAKEAAKEFVEKVINDADKVQIKESPSSGGGMAMLERRIELDLSGFDPWALVGIGSARARTPAPRKPAATQPRGHTIAFTTRCRNPRRNPKRRPGMRRVPDR